eukprot:gene7493-1785_t
MGAGLPLAEDGEGALRDQLTSAREFQEGFPQGTVLGPVFWGIYVGDVVEAPAQALPPGVRHQT